ncbi:MAG: DinB family protein [Gemmatimonadetes bacterium]|nr:DinB family protein [Gemmatimonadota bacterium]
MTSIRALLQELDQETGATRRVLERVDVGQLGWRPHPKSLTLGQLAMHVALIPVAIAELSTRESFDVGEEIPRPSAASIDELLSTLDRSVDGARSILGAMTDDDLETPWRMMLGDREVGVMPRGALLRSVLFNHWYHHRGQLCVYLRQTGALVPAVYGPSADETPLQLDQLEASRR